MRGASRLREALRLRVPKLVGRQLWTHRLNYVGAMKAIISQDTEGVVLCFEQGPEGRVKVI